MARAMNRVDRMRSLQRAIVLSVLSFASACDGGDGPRGEPDAVGARIADALDGIAAVNPDVITVAHRIHEPAGAALIGDVDAETCARVEEALWGMCTIRCERGLCQVRASIQAMLAAENSAWITVSQPVNGSG